MNQKNDELGPELRALFDAFDATPGRDPQAVAQGRSRFQSELDA